MFGRKFKIYFRVHRAYKRVLIEPSLKVNNRQFVSLNHSHVCQINNEQFLSHLFSCSATTLIEYSHAV